MNTLFLRSILLKAAWMLLMGMTITSCITDDLTDCPPPYNVRLVVKTDADAKGFAVSPTFDRYHIDSLSVYVFDGEGRYVTSWSGGRYTKGLDYVVPLKLEPGEYQFAAVTNQDFCRMNYTPGQCESLRPSLDDFKMSLNLPTDRQVTTGVPDLLLGMLSPVTVSKERADNNFTVIIYPQTYEVNFTVIGLPAAEEYCIMITDRDFMRTLKNEMTPLPDEFRYHCAGQLVAITPATKREASMVMYNLMDSKKMPLVVSDVATGEQMYSSDLIEMIENAYNKNGHTVDFNTEYEFNIVITFMANLGVEVSVNGWEYTDQEQRL